MLPPREITASPISSAALNPVAVNVVGDLILANPPRRDGQTSLSTTRDDVSGPGLGINIIFAGRAISCFYADQTD